MSQVAVVTNSRLLFNKIPEGFPKPGETTRIDRSQTIDLDQPLKGKILIKVLMVAIDPYLRGKMRPANVESYSPPFILGQPISNFGIGKVLRSDNAKFKSNDHVYGPLDFQEYVLVRESPGLRVLHNEANLPWSVFLGALGMPGQTAWIGWKLFAQAKQGETVFVTTAAGPVGSNVVQIAKSEGLKVIASAGSDEKVEFVKGLGADVVFNYKKKSTKEALKELGHGIDIYWDHVGGEMLEAALDAMNPNGRLILCGAISTYNSPDKYGIKNMHHVLTKRLTMHGFIVLYLLEDHLEEFYREYPKKIIKGQVKHREQLYEGLEGAEQALLEIQQGKNYAKPVAVLAND